jgi:hypothetical protein
MYSHALQEQKRTQINTKMQNGHFVSKPELHALSNGALVLAVSLILWTGKLIKQFTELCFH